MGGSPREISPGDLRLIVFGIFGRDLAHEILGISGILGARKKKSTLGGPENPLESTGGGGGSVRRGGSGQGVGKGKL